MVDKKDATSATAPRRGYAPDRDAVALLRRIANTGSKVRPKDIPGSVLAGFLRLGQVEVFGRGRSQGIKITASGEKSLAYVSGPRHRRDQTAHRLEGNCSIFRADRPMGAL